MKNQTAIRAAISAEFSSYINERKDLTVGEILYSFCRPLGKQQDNKISSLLNKTDSEILSKIEKAKIAEDEH